MKTLKLGILMVCMFAISNTGFGQAFSKGDVRMSVTIGAAHYWHLRGMYASPGYPGWGGYWSPVSGNAFFTMEFAPGRYLGAGFFAGFGGSAVGWGSGSINVPVGGFANFHFYQLIADKTGKDIHADKLDIYAGLNIGTGLGFWTGFPSDRANALIFGGPTVGINYYFKPKIAVTGEMGYGKTLFSAGISFKL